MHGARQGHQKTPNTKKFIRKNFLKNNSIFTNKLSGLGVKSLRYETEVQFFKKRVYLQHHPDLIETKNRFIRLAKKGWRNPITDAEKIFVQYEIEIPAKEEGEEIIAYCRRVGQ